MIAEIAVLRIKLLFRQRLFWIGMGLSVSSAGLSYLVGQISFVKPEKIFWDFALGCTFLIQTFLAIFFGSFLFSEEKEKRTLHWVLSMKVSRTEWLAGNFLGLGFSLFLVGIFSTFLTVLGGFLFSARPDLGLVFQTTFLTLLESWIVLSMAFFFSIWVRPVLSFSLLGILVFFLHSQDSLRRILVDPVSGRFVENRGLQFLFYLARLLPPLQWFDLRDLVGYQPAISWLAFGGIVCTALLWILILGVFSALKFERIDL